MEEKKNETIDFFMRDLEIFSTVVRARSGLPSSPNPDSEVRVSKNRPKGQVMCSLKLGFGGLIGYVCHDKFPLSSDFLHPGHSSCNNTHNCTWNYISGSSFTPAFKKSGFRLYSFIGFNFTIPLPTNSHDFPKNK